MASSLEHRLVVLKNVNRLIFSQNLMKMESVDEQALDEKFKVNMGIYNEREFDMMTYQRYVAFVFFDLL